MKIDHFDGLFKNQACTKETSRCRAVGTLVLNVDSENQSEINRRASRVVHRGKVNVPPIKNG